MDAHDVCGYKVDVGYMNHAYHALGVSVPWPDFEKPSFDQLPPLIPSFHGDKVYFVFDADDSSHPFSNKFVAPLPVRGLIAPTVRNFKMAVDAEEYDPVDVAFRNYVLTDPNLDESEEWTRVRNGAAGEKLCYCDRTDQVQAKAVLQKFLFYPKLREMLRWTMDAQIVACSEDWSTVGESCGVPMKDFSATCVRPWPNKLGVALMAVRAFFNEMLESELCSTVENIKNAKTPGPYSVSSRSYYHFHNLSSNLDSLANL